MVHEEPGSYGPTGLEFRDAKTGALIFGLSGQGADVGRGVREVNAVLFEGKSCRKAVSDLMERVAKPEKGQS